MPTRNKKILPPGTKDGEAVVASSLVRGGLLCGVVAPLLWVAVIAIAGELRPGFDHVRQYISELGERGSSAEMFMRYGGFVATGFMHIIYAAAFYAVVIRVSGQARLTLLLALFIALNGIGRVGAGVFACEPGCAAPEILAQRLHSLSATIAFLSIIAAATLGAIVFRADNRLRPLAAYSFASGCAGLIFLWLMSSSEATHAFTGLYERLASGVLTLWVGVTALWLLSLSAPNADQKV